MTRSAVTERARKPPYVARRVLHQSKLGRKPCGDHARRSELGIRVARQMILELDDDPTGPACADAVARELATELGAERHANTVSTAFANPAHSSRRRASAARPRLVRRYTRRLRPVASDHALDSSPSASSRWSTGYRVPLGELEGAFAPLPECLDHGVAVQWSVPEDRQDDRVEMALQHFGSHA